MNFSTSVQPLKLVRTRANSNTAIGDRRVSYGTAPMHVSFSHQEEQSMLQHPKQALNSMAVFDQKLRKQAQQLFEENETLKSRIDVISSSVTHLNERIRRKDEEYNRAASNLQQKSSECFQLKEQADELARKNKTYKRQTKDMQVELKEVREQLKVERQLRVQLQAEKNTLLQKLQYLRQSGEALAQDIIGEQVERVASDYQQQVDRLNQIISTLTGKLSSVERELGLTKQQQKESQQRVKVYTTELQSDLKKATEKAMQLQQAIKLAEREKEEWQQQRPALKQTAVMYQDLSTKYEKLESKYEDIVERYNEAIGKQKLVETQARELKSRLRLTEQERDRYQHQHNQLLERDRLLEQPQSRQHIYRGKVANSSFLDEQKSIDEDHHQINQTSSMSINNFASINLTSANDKKPLGNTNKNVVTSKSNQALGKLIHDSSKERVAALRSESQEDNILMTEQYIPTGEQTDSRVEQCGQRKVGGIRSRCRNKSGMSSERRQNENISPIGSPVPTYNNSHKRQPQHSQLSKIASDQHESSDKTQSFQQLLHRFEQLKSRSRQRVL